jgi:hypothetical protein
LEALQDNPPIDTSLPAQETEAWVNKLSHEPDITSEFGIRKPELPFSGREDDIVVVSQDDISQQYDRANQ